MTCFICGAKVSQMNDIISMRTRETRQEMLSFGLSVLHAYIRFFECLLHVAYRLNIKSWKVSIFRIKTILFVKIIRPFVHF